MSFSSPPKSILKAISKVKVNRKSLATAFNTSIFKNVGTDTA